MTALHTVVRRLQARRLPSVAEYEALALENGSTPAEARAEAARYAASLSEPEPDAGGLVACLRQFRLDAH